MTIAICSNEHDLLWVFDHRVDDRWFANRDTPVGTYCSIAASFVGDPLEVVHLQETESQKVLLADPKWVGIIAYLGIEAGHSHLQPGILCDYIDFVSPYGNQLRLTALDYAQEYDSIGFNADIFNLKAWHKYDLKPCQVKAAILYAKRISKGCKTKNEFAAKLDAVFEKVKTIDRLHISPIAARVDLEMNSTVTSVVGDLLPEAEIAARGSRAGARLDFDTNYFAPR